MGVDSPRGEWAAHLQRPDSFLATVSYQDKFGTLGKIAVVTGSGTALVLTITSWVMSCRAFSRYIEHHTLDRLFAHFEADELEFAFSATERNGPLQEFLIGISERLHAPPVRVTRQDSREKFRVIASYCDREWIKQRADYRPASRKSSLSLRPNKFERQRRFCGKWDSMASITLLTLVGEEFGTELDMDDFEQFTSYQGILEYLRMKERESLKSLRAFKHLRRCRANHRLMSGS